MKNAAGAPAGVLDGVKVVDLAQGLAGAMCARLLAESGAEVVLVEPPGGDPRRGTPQFAAWNRSKESVSLDWLGAERGKLDRLLAGADILIHDLAPSEARRVGLDAESLRDALPTLTVCTIGSYPLGHSQQDLPHDDFLVLAQAGILDEQPVARRDGPAYIPFPLGSWGAAWLAAVGVAARRLVQSQGGPAGSVATSLLQGGLAHTMTHWRVMETPAAAAAGWPKNARNSILECSDGVWLHIMGAPDKVPLMQQELERMGPEEVARLNQALGMEHRLFPNLGANIEAFRRHPSEVWLQAMWSADLAVQPVMRMGEVYFDEQARAMDYVAEIDDPELGPVLQPGPHIRLSPPLAIKGPAPPRGGEPPPWTPRAGQPREPQADKPLNGLRVLDFGQHLAGPFGAMLLADLGAEVIKIESIEGDAMRPFEWAFIGCQRGKRALACNLKDPSTREAILALVRGADVVMHNLRLPAAERLGIGYADLSAENPRLIYTHCSAYGSEGPRRDWPGYDQLFQALSGWEHACSGEGNPPQWLRFGMMDHQCAFAATYGTLLALIAREATGRGQMVSTSILGAAMMTTSGAMVVRPDGATVGAPWVDAEQTGTGPGRRLYRCADGWIAMTADDAALATLGADLEARFAVGSAEAAVALARAAGAQIVRAPTDAGAAFLTDPENAALKLATSYPHRRYGKLTQPGALLFMDGAPMVSDLAPSVLGQDSLSVLDEAGCRGATVERMMREGLVVQDS